MDSETQEQEVMLVDADDEFKAEEFKKAIKFSDEFNEKIKELIRNENRGELKEKIEEKILKFVSEAERKDVFIMDECGIEEVLLEIIVEVEKEGKKEMIRKQQPCEADFFGIAAVLDTVWFGRFPKTSDSQVSKEDPY